MEQQVLEKPKTNAKKTLSSQNRSRVRTSETTSSSENRIGKLNKELGMKGEDAAANFLYRRGYTILERNWTCFAGEADIIAKHGSTLVFVEVKTRSSCDKGFPSEAITSAKRNKYEKIALTYLSEYEGEECPIRFDVVSLVVLGKARAMIRHHINAFSVA